MNADRTPGLKFAPKPSSGELRHHTDVMVITRDELEYSLWRGEHRLAFRDVGVRFEQMSRRIAKLEGKKSSRKKPSNRRSP